MAISYNEQERVFRLDTPCSTYLIALVDEEGFPAHMYYGRRIPDDNMRHLMRLSTQGENVPFSRSGTQVQFLNNLPMEYSCWGQGDFRESCLRVETQEGYQICALHYSSHKIYSGKPILPGLPATWGEQEQCQTLELVLQDEAHGLEVHLLYTIFEQLDAICRSVRIVNHGGKIMKLTTALSACLDMEDQNFDILTLQGSWSCERMISRRRLGWGKQGVSSQRGISSHEANPFIALVEHSATQTDGQVYAMNFVYSGNFIAQAECSQQGQVRLVMGIHPSGFSWKLQPGESFHAPEVVMVYSCNGLGGMTRTFHDLYRRHLIRGPYRDKARPSLINSWEAAYFDFNEEKLLNIAHAAADAGIEMLVMDDGWFGRRQSDTSSLGDWYVNREKLPNGLPHLVEEVNKLGLKFGIWIEPEMVSPDSEMYRNHPDYALQIPGWKPSLSRNQLVLDLSRKDVRDCVYEQIHRVLSSANISYVKWDMNRPLTDVGSFRLEPDQQGELCHRYMLGVYELQERLLQDFPNILLENCCSGGGRFDPGMLYYSPQIWTSDNTEAVDRLKIQEGTALVYPLCSMGAHVAACPSHSNARVTPFSTRGLASLVGCFGYELDLTQLSVEERAMIPGQLELYKQYGKVFREGDYFRLASYSKNATYDALLSVSKDKRVAVLVYIQVMSGERMRPVTLNMQGLDESLYYRSGDTGQVLSGAGWMYGGMLMPQLKGDFTGKLIVLEAVEV